MTGDNCHEPKGPRPTHANQGRSHATTGAERFIQIINVPAQTIHEAMTPTAYVLSPANLPVSI